MLATLTDQMAADDQAMSVDLPQAATEDHHSIHDDPIDDGANESLPLKAAIKRPIVDSEPGEGPLFAGHLNHQSSPDRKNGRRDSSNIIGDILAQCDFQENVSIGAPEDPSNGLSEPDSNEVPTGWWMEESLKFPPLTQDANWYSGQDYNSQTIISTDLSSEELDPKSQVAACDTQSYDVFLGVQQSQQQPDARHQFNPLIDTHMGAGNRHEQPIYSYIDTSEHSAAGYVQQEPHYVELSNQVTCYQYEDMPKYPVHNFPSYSHQYNGTSFVGDFKATTIGPTTDYFSTSTSESHNSKTNLVCCTQEPNGTACLGRGHIIGGDLDDESANKTYHLLGQEPPSQEIQVDPSDRNQAMFSDQTNGCRLQANMSSCYPEEYRLNHNVYDDYQMMQSLPSVSGHYDPNVEISGVLVGSQSECEETSDEEPAQRATGRETRLLRSKGMNTSTTNRCAPETITKLREVLLRRKKKMETVEETPSTSSYFNSEPVYL